MKIVKIISNKTYIGKDGNTYHYNNYAILLDNGRQIQIRPAFTKDYTILNAIAELIDLRKEAKKTKKTKEKVNEVTDKDMDALIKRMEKLN
ncbi:MAG TPA: hypothetical protein VJZ99_00030 [Patescibacteria group bacterium]|nr:hypothetical protein [Patescibacteria group bacterium]